MKRLLPYYTFSEHYYLWQLGIDFERIPYGWDFRKKDYLKFDYHFRLMIGPYTLDWMV